MRPDAQLDGHARAPELSAHDQIQSALHTAGDSFRQLVEGSPFGIYAVDADFRLVLVSQGAQKVFSNVRPLLGRDFDDVMHCLWSEPFVSEALDRFRHTLATGESYRKSSTVEQRVDTGATEAYDWQVDRMTLPDGRPGVVCHFYDLSERQKYEAALREADRKKDEFLATLAHELRNPLAPIRSGLEIMKLAATDARLIERSREIMERQVSQLTRLINDLMDVSRIGQGKVVMRKAPMRIADAVQNAIDSVRPTIDARGHDLSVHVSDDALHVDGDLARLSQVFANLLDNAAKFTPRGGRIEVAVHAYGDEVEVSVVDNGVGIPAQMLSAVFEMFTQLDRSSQAQSGLGIGLNIVKRLVQAHDGYIEVQSAGPGAGSTFMVRLPVVVVHTSLDDAPSRDAAARNPASRRILVVDDNRDAADSLTMMLSIQGNETQAAHDGEEAVALAETFRPDVILMDIGMPKLDGYEACRQIRAQPWGRGIVIIAQTGWGGERDKADAIESGFDFHLTKPVDPDALDQLLSES